MDGHSPAPPHRHPDLSPIARSWRPIVFAPSPSSLSSSGGGPSSAPANIPDLHLADPSQADRSGRSTGLTTVAADGRVSPERVHEAPPAGEYAGEHATEGDASANDEQDDETNRLRRQVAALSADLNTVSTERDVALDRLEVVSTRYASVKSELTRVLFETCVSDPAPMLSLPVMLGDNESSHKFAAYDMADGLERWRSSLSVVRSVVRRSDKLPCVIKQIRKSNCRSLRAVKRVDREIRILKFLRHPGIIPLLDTWQSREHVLMVFKEYKVDLFGFMDPYKNGVCEEYVIQILRSAVDVVQYMHQQGVYHLDIKPENLLIVGDGTAEQPFSIVMIDFGVSLCRGDLDLQGMAKGLAGSVGFYAPEMLDDVPYLPGKADLFSLGCVLLELLAGHVGFKDLWILCYNTSGGNHGEATQLFAALERARLLMIPPDTTAALSAVLSSLLHRNPALRAYPEMLSRFEPNVVSLGHQNDITSGGSAAHERGASSEEPPPHSPNNASRALEASRL